MINGVRDIQTLSSPPRVVMAMAVLIAVDVSARLLPHDPNSTPLAASALFAGFLMNSRWVAMLVPLISMLISDLIIGIYDWRIMVVVYLSIALPALAGRLGRARHGALILGGLALGSSLVFFLTTNFAVWLFSRMYTADLSGLLQCYLVAWPFFRNALRGDLLWMTAFWSAYILARSGLAKKPMLQTGARHGPIPSQITS